jgi:hypothetical protein
MLRLESPYYNKLYPGLKFTTSMRLDERKPLLVVFKSLPNFSKYCMHIIHFQLSILLGSRLSSSHIVVVAQVPPSTLHDVCSFLRHVIMLSHTTLCLHPLFDLSKRMLFLTSPMIALI